MARTEVPLTPRLVRQFLLEMSRQAADNSKQLGTMFRVSDEYRPIMREHYRTIVKMETDDPVFVELANTLETNVAISLWYHVLVRHSTEGLLTAPNLGVFILQGLKHKEPIADKVLKLLQDRLDSAENYVEMREAMSDLVALIVRAEEGESKEDFSETARPIKDSVDEANERYKQSADRFGQPFIESWEESFTDDCGGLRVLGEEEGMAILKTAWERYDALRQRDDAVDKIIVPWIEATGARKAAEVKDQQARQAEEERATRLAERKARRAEREAAAALTARTPVQQPKPPPIHPDLADAIEMVNVVDAADRIEALKDLRETALAITLEHPGDPQAERWATWAKEQMRLARRPDTEWSVIDGQFRSCSFQPNNRNEKEET